MIRNNIRAGSPIDARSLRRREHAPPPCVA